MSPTLSRRQFLKLSSLMALALAPHRRPQATQTSGRVAVGQVKVRAEPSKQSKILRYWYLDRLIEYGAEVPPADDQSGPANWLQLSDGAFVYGGDIQPVASRPQTPLTQMPAHHFLAEVSVPFSDSRAAARADSRRVQRLYYGSVHWITDVRTNATGQTWYRIWNELDGGNQYALGTQLRIVATTELAPLNADVTTKKLVVDTALQTVYALENEREVFSTRCATGLLIRKNDVVQTSTPLGNYAIWLKRPSRHMRGDEQNASYDLAGVPWFSMFTDYGVGFHGVYWHNEFGRPRSHGCVNVPTEAARWIYRWSAPSAPAGEKITLDQKQGTKVIVQ